MTRKVGKRRSKQGQHKRRVDRQIVGLTMEWFDENPDTEGEIYHPVLSHKNAMMRPLAKRIWQENLDYLKHKSQFRWLVSVEGVFNDERDGKRYCPVELEAKCVLEDMNAHVLQAVQGVMERGNRKLWLGATIKIECLGV